MGCHWHPIAFSNVYEPFDPFREAVSGFVKPSGREDRSLSPERLKTLKTGHPAHRAPVCMLSALRGNETPLETGQDAAMATFYRRPLLAAEGDIEMRNQSAHIP